VSSIDVIGPDGQRLPSGSKAPKGARYRARWRTPEGASRVKTFERKLDAERHITAVEHSKLTASYVDPALGRMTVADYWAVWSARQPWRESSRSSVTSLFDRHILPALGRRQLASIRRGELEAWAGGLPLAARTARQAAQYLSTMLDSAVADGLIARNPAHGSKRPRVSGEPVVPFTDDEVAALRAATPGWFEVALDLGLGAGLRQSEASGLTLDRVDFLRRTLTVDRQLVTPTRSGPATLGPPKTKRSYRTVPLADAVIDRLARHIETHGTGRHGLLLHGTDGRPIRRQWFGDVWRRVRVDAGLPNALFHATRHTFASVLLSGGVSVAAAAEYLGHSPSVLLSVYAHLMPADHDRARSVVAAAFAPASSRVTTVSGAAAGRER
jgi:integrase